MTNFQKLVKFGRFGMYMLTVSVSTASVGNTVFSVIGYPAQVNGASMKPTLNEDLCTGRGVVLGRAATTLRSIETQPF
jgi:signal peptidase I